LSTEAIGIEAEERSIPAGVARTAGAVCESLWKLFRVKSEPPVTRFSADQLSTSHWYNISASRRDFGYQPEISIAEGLEVLRAYSDSSGRR